MATFSSVKSNVLIVVCYLAILQFPILVYREIFRYRSFQCPGPANVPSLSLLRPDMTLAVYHGRKATNKQTIGFYINYAL